MDLTKMECFLSVVRNQNYTLAAEQVCLSQSSVSKHILQMEKELGVSLLDRNTNHTRKVTLTEAGKDIFGDVEAIWETYQGILEKLSKYKEKQVLRIGSVDHLQKVGVMAPIAEFMTEHSEIQVEFEEADTITLLDLLLKRQIDVAFIAHIYYSGLGNLRDFPLEKYQRHTLVKDHYYLAVNKNHRLAGFKNVEWKDLNEENLILLDKSFSSNAIIRSALESYGCTGRIAFETNGTDSIWGMILANYGVALLSKKVIQQMKGVVAVSMKKPIHRDTVLLKPNSATAAGKCFWRFFLSQQEGENGAGKS